MWWKESQNNQANNFTQQQPGVLNIPPVNVNIKPISPAPTSFNQLFTKPTVPQKQLITKDFVASAYCPCKKCCGPNANGMTAMGTKAQAGRTTAVPQNIPLGTKLNVNGKEYVAEDHGGGIKENRIDIFFNTHPEALAFGMKPVKISYYA